MENVNKVSVVTGNQEAMEREIAELRAKLKAATEAKKSSQFTLTLAHFEKAGVQKVGINVFGITAKPIFLYVDQAEKMLTEEFQVALGQFIDVNKSVLTRK